MLCELGWTIPICFLVHLSTSPSHEVPTCSWDRRQLVFLSWRADRLALLLVSFQKIRYIVVYYYYYYLYPFSFFKKKSLIKFFFFLQNCLCARWHWVEWREWIKWSLTSTTHIGQQCRGEKQYRGLLSSLHAGIWYMRSVVWSWREGVVLYVSLKKCSRSFLTIANKGWQQPEQGKKMNVIIVE